jgi:hypothetical protein
MQLATNYYQNVKQFFPNLDDGQETEAIVNMAGLSPLMNTRALYV